MDGWHGNIPMSKVYSTRFRNKLLNNFIQGLTNRRNKVILPGFYYFLE